VKFSILRALIYLFIVFLLLKAFAIFLALLSYFRFVI